MYGPGYHHHGLRYWRGPSRLLWFFLGAGAATFWIKRKECRDGNSWSRHCVRAPIQPPTFSSGESTSWSPRDIPRAINNIPVGEYSNNQPRGTQAWEEERERMLALSQKAGDKMTELSEATLDTVLTTVEVLKAKLAEHRAERQKQLEEDRKREADLPRLV